jgi:hypothetical protein
MGKWRCDVIYLNLGTGERPVASFTPQPFHLLGKSASNRLVRSVGGRYMQRKISIISFQFGIADT